jgi:25S rRNA (adenine2142-N1)-methyltransferase
LRDLNICRLLEVGALKHDNYVAHASWIDCIPIDLRSRHPLIREQDFVKMDEQAQRGQWDGISLSLVINFVPDAHDRGA